MVNVKYVRLLMCNCDECLEEREKEDLLKPFTHRKSECPNCGGTGYRKADNKVDQWNHRGVCTSCNGTGTVLVKK